MAASLRRPDVAVPGGLSRAASSARSPRCLRPLGGLSLAMAAGFVLLRGAASPPSAGCTWVSPGCCCTWRSVWAGGARGRGWSCTWPWAWPACWWRWRRGVPRVFNLNTKLLRGMVVAGLLAADRGRRPGLVLRPARAGSPPCGRTSPRPPPSDADHLGRELARTAHPPGRAGVPGHAAEGLAGPRRRFPAVHPGTPARGRAAAGADLRARSRGQPLGGQRRATPSGATSPGANTTGGRSSRRRSTSRRRFRAAPAAPSWSSPFPSRTAGWCAGCWAGCCRCG